MSARKVEALLAGTKTAEILPVTKANRKSGKTPYLPGDVILVKEAFRYEGDRICWQADADSFDLCNCRWHAATLLPSAACRLGLRITGVKRKRMSQLTVEDGISCGFGDCLVDGLETANPLAALLLDWKLSRFSDYRRENDPEVWVLNFTVERGDWDVGLRR